MEIIIEKYIGADTLQYVDIISKLRIDAFKEYPYLYKGEMNYERKYTLQYTTDKQAMIVVAKVDGVLAGISTGIPLNSDAEIVADAKKIFSNEEINIADYYYYGEVIVLPEFRGLGITTQLYSAQDELIKSWGFKHVCILTVVREQNHPLKPAGYNPPDKMWEHLGFTRSLLTINFHWPTILPDNTIANMTNTLEFWTKNLANVSKDAAQMKSFSSELQ